MSEESTTTSESAESAKPMAGHLHDMGIVDLRSAKTPEDLKGITSISDVGLVLIPESLAAALLNIPMNDVGTVIPVPQDAKLNFLMGQTHLSGEALSSGDPECILFIAGQVFITSAITSIGYKELRVAGQVFATRGSEAAVTAKLTQLTGQIFYLPANPRLIMGEETIGAEFLELLPDPTALVIMGELTIENGVTSELLKSKVIEIVLMGKIIAPKALIPLLQVLTKEKMGEIVSAA